MLGLNIAALPDFRYRVALIKNCLIQWSTECGEIDLDETVSKVLRASKNLRELPGEKPIDCALDN